MKPVKLLSLLDVLQFENTHRKRTILGVVELSGCWGFGFAFFFFGRQLFLSQGPTIPSWNRLLWANLPPPHPSSKAASDSDSNNSQRGDILTALSSAAAQKQAGTPACTPAQESVPRCPLKHHKYHFCSLWLCRDTYLHPQVLQHPSHTC